jgi:hypothetical protein
LTSVHCHDTGSAGSTEEGWPVSADRAAGSYSVSNETDFWTVLLIYDCLWLAPKRKEDGRIRGKQDRI